jgi:predicted DNA-binding transcriptional regulator AlpA
MTIYEFAIIASGLDHTADDFESRFYDAGCDDATVSFQKGRIIVDFAREANAIEDAISTAMKAVQATGAKIDRVEPDPLVSLAEIASRTGMTRAAMTQYSKGQRGKDFPPPVARVTTESPLWDWADVAVWFFHQKKITRETAIQAGAVREANRAIASGDPSRYGHLKSRISEYEAAL